jgi:general secretion pathway protein I
MSASGMRGFTLIEVVIAFAILALSLSALYAAFANALSRAQRDAQLSEGTLIARSLLARAGSELSAAQGSYQGEWNNYKYELTQQSVSLPAQQSPLTLPLLRVTARVWWSGNYGLREINLSTLELAPKVQQ